MTQVRLDEKLFPKKIGKINNSSISVMVNNTKIKQDGLMKLYVDIHEPEEIIEMLRKEKGIYVEVQSLQVGDYAFSNCCIERKTLLDFYNSICHGDKHIWKQIFNLKHAFERPMLIIERWDDSLISSPKMENTIRGTIASIFLMGVSVLVIPGKGKNVRPFVDQLAYLFYSSDKKALSMKPVPEKRRLSEAKKEELLSDIICMIPGIGRAQADLLAGRISCIEELCKMSDEDLKRACPRLGTKRMNILRWLLNGRKLEE